MNKVILIGRVSSRPILLNTKSNVPFLRFSLAVSRRRYSQDATPITDFIPIVAWRQNATLLERLITVGTLIALEGSIQGNRAMNNTNAYLTNYEVNVDSFQPLETKEQLEIRRQKLSQKISEPTFEPIYDDNQVGLEIPEHDQELPDESQNSDFPSFLADKNKNNSQDDEDPFADWDLSDIEPDNDD